MTGSCKRAEEVFLLWLCNVGIILIYIAFSATTTTNFILRLVIESHCCKAGRKRKKGSSAELQHVPHVYALLRFCGPDPLPPRRSFFAVAVQCWHHSDLHCLFCYDDDELHLTSCDRESLLQSWQKEKKREFSGASTYIYIECIYILY